MKYQSQKIALGYFAVALALFAVQVSMGLIMGWIYVYAATSCPSSCPSTSRRMLHTNSLVVWLLLGFFGAAYYLVPEESEREIHSPMLAWLQLAIFVLGTAGVVVTYLFNLFDGQLASWQRGPRVHRTAEMGQGRHRRRRADLPLQHLDDGAGGQEDRDHQHPAAGPLGPVAAVPVRLREPRQPGAGQAVLVVHRPPLGRRHCGSW